MAESLINTGFKLKTGFLEFGLPKMVTFYRITCVCKDFNVLRLKDFGVSLSRAPVVR